MNKKRMLPFIFFLVLILEVIYFYFIFLSDYRGISLGLNNNTGWAGNLTGTIHGSIALGDIDNDSILDLILSGCKSGGLTSCTSPITRVYINNGTTLTENSTWQQNLTGVGWSSLALGDIDNDGRLDLALSGYNSTDGIVKIYINNGTSLVENQTFGQNLNNVSIYSGSLKFGDIDNDGKLDLAIGGAYGGSCGGTLGRTGIYINNGSSFVKNSTWLNGLPPNRWGEVGGEVLSLNIGDLNNDGRLDLIVMGNCYTNTYFQVYLNNGTSLVENSTWEQNLHTKSKVDFILANYDNNAYLDMAAIGVGDSLIIYDNTGNGFIVNESEASQGYCCLGGYYSGSVVFGDYDNNGTLDLAAMGLESGQNAVYYNGPNRWNVTFDKDINASVDLKKDNLNQGSVVWVDIDNDTDLDLAITGTKATTGIQVSTIYINNGTTNNNLPKHPNSTDFSATYANNQLTLRWGNGSDNETPINGLYYNLRVGTSSGGNQIVSGVYGGSSNPTAGYFGNMMQRKSITLHGDWLQASTIYYWSVQTIDTGLAKSNWSAEQTFSTAADITYPSITINFPDDNNYTSFSNVTFNTTVSDNVNVSNVSLYGTWGNWHRNQTNSSGINGTSYIFQANLSAYGEGSYTWAIHSCDTTGNCIFSVNRTILRDLTAPLIYLESPADSFSWTDNNSVTFFFNVTDFSIQNCSLIVGSSLKYNFTSVTVNTSTSATITLTNGNYNWSVNCTDMLLRQNSSKKRQLTVNYQAPATPTSSSGGGGGGGIAYSTYSVGELKEAQEVNKELGKGDKIKFNLKGEEHKLELKKITSDTTVIEINSSAFNFTLAVNESRKLNLSDAEFYDLVVKLNNLRYFKANLTIMAIHEEIYVKPIEEKPTKPAENITEIKNKTEEKSAKIEEKEKPRAYLWIIFGLISLVLVILLIPNRRKKK